MLMTRHQMPYRGPAGNTWRHGSSSDRLGGSTASKIPLHTVGIINAYLLRCDSSTRQLPLLASAEKMLAYKIAFGMVFAADASDFAFPIPLFQLAIPVRNIVGAYVHDCVNITPIPSPLSYTLDVHTRWTYIHVGRTLTLDVHSLPGTPAGIRRGFSVTMSRKSLRRITSKVPMCTSTMRRAGTRSVPSPLPPPKPAPLPPFPRHTASPSFKLLTHADHLIHPRISCLFEPA